MNYVIQKNSVIDETTEDIFEYFILKFSSIAYNAYNLSVDLGFRHFQM